MSFEYIKTEYSGSPDPLSLYRQEVGSGAGFLLESADITTKQGQQSIIGLDICLTITSRDGEVTWQGQGELGKAISCRLMQELGIEETKINYQSPKMEPDEQVRMMSPSPVDVLRKVLNVLDDPESALIAGAFAYDFIDFYEDIGPISEDPLDVPDFCFYVPRTYLTVYHQENRCDLFQLKIKGVPTPKYEFRQIESESFGESQSQILESLTSDQEFISIVEQTKEFILAGDIFQAVPSRLFRLPCSDPFSAYYRLKKANPSPYMFFMNLDGAILFGASPETAVKVSNRMVEIRPIAGTKPRGRAKSGEIDLDLDSRLEAELRLDEKELAEHMMLIDLARNDIARVSQPATRWVPKLLTIDRYSHVMHLVSYVQGKLKPQLDAFHAYVSSMNMGTLVGAPKVRAAQIVRQMESGQKRGIYGGAVGYFKGNGDMDSAIAIRSALVIDGVAHIRAGAGVVHDSNPKEEVLETHRKAGAVIAACGGQDVH